MTITHVIVSARPPFPLLIPPQSSWAQKNYGFYGHPLYSRECAEVKRIVADPLTFSHTSGVDDFNYQLFGDAVLGRLLCKEVWLNKNSEVPEREEAKVVMEITVEEDMLNGAGMVHGSCSAFLIDICSSVALAALSMNTTGEIIPSVSQALNMTCHSPIGLGDELCLICTTLTLGSRAQSSRTEIWNLTRRRLAVSGSHVKLQPSSPPNPVL